MTDIQENIALRLKSIRKERGLTLEELAELCGVSKSMLGEIERGGTNPTIVVLWKIAEGLKVPITAFLEEEKPPYSVVRAAELQPFNRDEDYSIYNLFPYSENSRNEVLSIAIRPGGELSNDGHRLELDEILVVQQGMVEVELNGEVLSLMQGDAVRFEGAVAHRIRNVDVDTAKLFNLLNYH